MSLGPKDSESRPAKALPEFGSSTPPALWFELAVHQYESRRELTFNPVVGRVSPSIRPSKLGEMSHPCEGSPSAR